MTYLPADNRYDSMPYRRTGRSGLKLPAISLGLWQNFGGATGPLGQLLGSALPEGERQQIEALTREIGPTLVLAYGDADRVRLVARGGMGPLGMSFEKLLAVAGALREQAPSAEDADSTANEVETPVRTTA